MSRGRAVALAAAAGLVTAASLPPLGWWPLTIAGIALLGAALVGQPLPRRLLIGMVGGLAYFAVGIWWMHEFNGVGYVLAVIVEAAFLAAAAVAVHPRRIWTLAPALVVGEAARGHWPFGGTPLADIAMSQVAGPLGPAARLGGHLLVVALVALAAIAVVRWRRLWWVAAVVVGVALAAALVHPPPKTTTLRVALVQGGGPRGVRAVFRDPILAFDAQLRATERVRPPVDLVVWPEDVVDVERLAGSEAAGLLSGTARRLNATLVAGVVEDGPHDTFLNEGVVWSPAGDLVDRYEKVHRVPFGEYIPGRGLVEHLADVSAVPRDALPGKGPGVVRTPVGPLGISLSYEVFFAGRARAATPPGVGLLLVPTNASSFRGSQVPAQELAVARLRAIETGRTVLQVAPTGYTAVVEPSGHVRRHDGLGRPAVIQTTVVRRHGSTPARRFGEAGPVVVSVLALALARWRRDG